MLTRINPVRLNHMNLTVESVDDSARHFENLYGAEFLVDLPNSKFNACLLAFGGGLFELFAPHEWFLSARMGPYVLGVEYQADMETVREAITERSIRITRDVGVAIHTHPRDTFGVSFEFTEMYFTDKEWPLLGRPMRPPSYWRNEHPAGVGPFKGYSIAVRELDSAVEFLCGLFELSVVAEENRPAIGARMVGLKITDSIVELVTPTAPGMISNFITRYGEGIMTMLFGAAEEKRAQAYFGERNVQLVRGSSDRRLSISAGHDTGAFFELEFDA